MTRFLCLFVFVLMGVVEAATAQQAQREDAFVACLAKKHPDRVREIQQGLLSGRYSLKEGELNDPLPENDISFGVLQLGYQSSCLSPSSRFTLSKLDQSFRAIKLADKAGAE